LNLSAIKYGEMQGAIAAGCERLVHPRVTEDAERTGQARLLGLLLGGPFMIGAAAWLTMPATAGMAMSLAFICAVFGIAWLAALVVASTGQAGIVKRVALFLAAGLFALLVAAAGGLSSPAGLVVLALPIEAYIACRTRRAALFGTVALGAALVGAAALGPSLFHGASAAAWHWLIPLAYAATVLPRIGGLVPAASEATSQKDIAELEALVDAVVMHIAPNGDVVSVGDRARSHFGLVPDLLSGNGFFERIHIADRVGYLCALADMRDGALLRKAELRIRLPQVGEGQPVDNYRPFAIELSRPVGTADTITAVVRDNSELAELRRSLACAAESNERLDIAKGRFLAAVSHELRTPLNSIIGFSDMLLHEMFGAFGDPRQKEYVELVRDSGHHLLEVVNSILDVSKIEAGSYTTNPEPFRFREAVDMCSAMMSIQADAKAIALKTNLAPEIGDIHADKRAIQQILINLVSNALKFTPNGGRVTIGSKRIGSRLHFWVSDTGIGIAEEDLSRLGTPFTQVQNDYTRQFEGTGLGLSLVKGLVNLHDGTMSIDSELGAGTTVTITLPVDGTGREPGDETGEIVTMKMARDRENGNGALRKAG